MTLTTVANGPTQKLQNATNVYWVWAPSISIDHAGTDPVEVVLVEDPDNPQDVLLYTMMADRYEVDGITYPARMNGNSRHPISIRTDRSERCLRYADAEGYCDCQPMEYSPLTYRVGEICESCWLRFGGIVGIGKDGCEHHN